MTPERDSAIAAFLAREGFGRARRTPLSGDASFRRYERLRQDERSVLLMDAPPEREDVRPYLRIARHLRGLGLTAPDILAADETLGLLVIEDFGDDTFTRLLAAGAAEPPLYALAIDVLIDLHRRPPGVAAPPGTSPYDDERLLAEAVLLCDWYMPAVLGHTTDPGFRAEYLALWRAILPEARAVPETLVLRDYHVDNLMIVPGRAALASCGLLDFQDAVTGPVSYDVVSLLEDARRDVADTVRSAMRARYLAAFPNLDPRAFDRSMAILGAQRHCKVIGIFARLKLRDGKPIYLDHIPRLWRLLERSFDHPALVSMRELLARALPPERRVVPS